MTSTGVYVQITFQPPLIPAVLMKRYKRFLADVVLTPSGRF